MNNAAVAMAVAILLSPVLPSDWLAAQKSQSSGLFFGLGYEANAISTSRSDSVEAGSGGAFTLGYGFNKRLATYAQLSAADIETGGGAKYPLVHFDVGARFHFRTGPNAVVPFVQLGLTGRAVSQYVGSTSLRGTGSALTFGGGLNVHLAPSAAVSGIVTYTVGSFNHFAVEGSALSGVHAESARVYIGVLWYR